MQNCTLENSGFFFYKVKHILSIWPSNPTHRYSPNWKHIHTKTCFASVYSSFIHNAKNWKQPKYPSTAEWINKLGPSCNGILFSNNNKKKKQTSGTRDNTDKSQGCYNKGIMKIASLKRLQTAWFHLYNMLEKANKRKRKHISNFQELEVGKRTGPRGTWVIELFHTWMVVVVRRPRVSVKTHRTVHYRRMNFTICKL